MGFIWVSTVYYSYFSPCVPFDIAIATQMANKFHSIQGVKLDNSKE